MSAHRLKPIHLIVLSIKASDKGFTKSELAKKMNRPLQAINEIFNGKKRITEKTALEFEVVLGLDASILLSLQTEHYLELARRELGKK